MTDEAPQNRFASFQPDLPEEPEQKPAPFGDFSADVPEQVAMAPQKPNRFSQFSPDLPEETSALEAGGLHAALGAVPAIGSIPAAAAGAELGAMAGAPLGPVGSIAGGLIGGLTGGFGGAAVLSKAQEWALSHLPDSWKDPLDEKLRAAEIEHPQASFIGGLVPFALTMKPGGLERAAVPASATAMERLLANPVTGRLFGGGLMGGIELAQEKAQGKEADWADIAIATGFGVVFNKPTAFGQRLSGIGARAVKRGRVFEEDPTLAELADLGVMGKGVTEDTARGDLEMAPEAKIEARNARSAEMVPPEPDLHALARQHEPEIFDRYDALDAEREHYRARIRDLQSPSDEMMADAAAARDAAQQALDAHLEARGGYAGGAEARRLRANLREAQRAADELAVRREARAKGEAVETPEISDLRKRLMEVDAEMRDLGRDKAAAYRRAAELGETEMVAPEGVIPFGTENEPKPSEGKAEEAIPSKPISEQRAAIIADVARQLEEVGRPIEEAQKAAELIASRYVTRAVRFKGALGTPEELYAREGAIIRGQEGRVQGRAEIREIGPESHGPAGAAARQEAARPQEEALNFGQTSAPERPVSLLEFLSSKGLAPSSELKEIFDKENPRYGKKGQVKSGGQKLVREGGRSLDRALEAAVEAGYFHEAETGERVHTPSDLLDAIRAEFHGTPHYPRDMTGLDVRAAGAGKETAEYQTEMRRNRAAVMKELPWGFDDQFFLMPEGRETMDRAAGYMREGYDAREAWSLAHADYMAGQEAAMPWHAPEGWERELSQSAKGKITLRKGQKPIITLMRDADASTFIHETGHDFLEQLLRDAQHEAAPPELRDDATTALDWIGAKSVDDLKTKHHEKFARGFEQYLREGRAPSAELASVFAKFKAWLLDIYRTIRGLGAPINDDIRAVFDRMLAEEPRHTVIAPEMERQPSLADIHETDAHLTEPYEAGAAADRIDAEIARQIEELPEDERALIARLVEPGTEAASPAKPARTGERGGGGGEPPRTAVARPAAAQSEEGAGPRPVVSGVGAAAAETGGLRGERAGGAGKSPLDGIMPRGRETLIGKPNRISTLENLVTELGGEIDAETKKYLDGVLGKTSDFVEERRGHITHGQIAEWYEAAGLSPEEIPERQIGQSYNAEQMYEHYRAIKALNERIYQHGVNGDVVAYERDRALRETLIKGFVGARAEAGRALGVFRQILKEMRGTPEDSQEFFQLWRALTGKDFERSKTDAEAVSKLQNPAAVAQFLRNTEQRTYGRMAFEYWMSAIVSNYISQMTDVVGNFVTLANKLTLEVPVAAALGARAGEANRVRVGELGAGWKAIPGAVAPAAEAALKTLRTGQLVELPGQHLQTSLDIYNFGQKGEPLNEAAMAADVKAAAFGLMTGLHDAFRAMGAIHPEAPLIKRVDTERGLIPNLEIKGAEVPLGDFLRSPLNFLKSMESFSASIAFAVEKNQAAYRRAAAEGWEGARLDLEVAKLLKNPPTDLLEEAVKEARTNALAYKGGAISQKLSQLVNAAEVAGIPFGKFLVPFVNISSIMMNEALLKRTPLGFLSSEIRADLLGANGPIAQQKAQARMMVGSSIALMGMGLAAMGQITGSAPDDPKERLVWQAAGIQPYSVKIGDSWYSYKRLGVFGLHLGVAADMVLVAQKASQKEVSDAIGTFVHAVAKNVIDQSYFKGPSDFLRAVTEKGYGEHYVQNFLSGFVPFSSGMGQTAQLVDPYSREARNLVDAIKAKIPGLSQSLRPKLDMWGQPIPSRDPLGPFAVWVQKQATDPVAHEMRRIEYFPSAPEKKIRGVKLTDEQYHEFARLSGIMTKANLDRFVTSPRWGTIPDHMKKRAMEEAVRSSREAAIGQMFARYPNIIVEARDLKRSQIEGKPHGR